MSLVHNPDEFFSDQEMLQPLDGLAQDCGISSADALEIPVLL